VIETDDQTAPPDFVDAAAGDYAEAVGSPTIDAGVNAEGAGTTDLLGNPRALPGTLDCGPEPPAITDIGADEFVPTRPTCAPSTEAKQATGGGGRTAKPRFKVKITSEVVSGRRAVFRFDATGAAGSPGFGCKLDGKTWRRRKSPATYRDLRPGRHTFRVRPTEHGTVDGATVKRKFRIKQD